MMIKLTMLAALVSLAGCAGMQAKEQQSLADTREIALLIKSVGVSTATFQQRRDAIAASSQRQRDALESLARQQETELATTLADWHIEGATERRSRLDAVREEANLLTIALNRDEARDRAQALELKKVRSAVNFSQGKINESAASTMRLGEQASHTDQARFLIDFAKQAQAKIVADQAAEAKAQADRIAANTKETTP